VRVDRLDSGIQTELAAVADDTETAMASVNDLVVVAEFRDPIYPGMVPTGKVERGGDKPYHAVINAENYHALQALLFTHRGKVDCIYIDPPYNTGARDWKYNNDYVESDDMYRHSKWLAFMERRLLLAKKLLNLSNSLLIVTIDEREYLRLGLLLHQIFPEARIQMVSSVVSQKGVHRDIGMSRVDEYIFYVFLGEAVLDRLDPVYTGHLRAATRTQVWYPMLRTGTDSSRAHRPGCFYPVLVETKTGRILGCGDALDRESNRTSYVVPEGVEAIFPIASDGSEGRWQMGPASFQPLLDEGMVKLGRPDRLGRRPVMYIRSGMAEKIRSGEVETGGIDEIGVLEVSAFEGSQIQGARTQWNNIAHDATLYGSNLVKQLIPGRGFPFPKSLYAAEDSLRWYVNLRRSAVVLDFFAGSGTTAHAVMRLNRQDGGHRQCILVTNNEVSADEQTRSIAKGLRPGDPDWEALGICNHITKPRIEAAITGKRPDGEPIKGDYKFTDEFPMADGLEENVEFFTLTYEAPLRVASHRDFERVAPLLWLRAGSRGQRINNLAKGWDVAEAYGVLADLDQVDAFVEAVKRQDDLDFAFIVTDEDRLFESVVRELPDHVEPVRLYEAYLRNFEIESGRGAR
jgi:adenine-specific DNA-methyltransferase